MTARDDMWCVPSSDLILQENAVHVWRASLDVQDVQLDRLASMLSADERDRAGRLYFAHDQRHFVAARGILRALLGAYLGLEPHLLRFTYGIRGKPALAGIHGGWLFFNLAHSGGLALYALACHRQVGIDVERIRAVDDAGAMVERFFSPRERALFERIPPDRQQEAFFAWWTRKEAYVKAHGDGLAYPLDSFDVALSLDEPAALLQIRDGSGQAARWSLRDLALDPGYAAALAVAGHGWQLRCCLWPQDGLGGVHDAGCSSGQAYGS